MNTLAGPFSDRKRIVSAMDILRERGSIAEVKNATAYRYIPDIVELVDNVYVSELWAVDNPNHNMLIVFLHERTPSDHAGWFTRVELSLSELDEFTDKYRFGAPVETMPVRLMLTA